MTNRNVVLIMSILSDKSISRNLPALHRARGRLGSACFRNGNCNLKKPAFEVGASSSKLSSDSDPEIVLSSDIFGASTKKIMKSHL